MGQTLVTPPASFPVTLAEAKAQCRVRHSDEDTFINGLIAAATQHVEKQIGRAIIAQTWRLTLDQFSTAIRLPLSPLIAVDAVEYSDTAGITQTASASLYTVDNTSEPGWVVLNQDAEWPETIDAVGAVRITYQAGYATVPAPIKHAILLLIGHWFENREAVGEQMQALPMAVDALLVNYRAYGFVA